MENLINQEIIRVFDAYSTNPDQVFFGITGDIDDLGIYVANHGRPKAENLVELWNLIIIDYLQSWRHLNEENITEFYLGTSGEEVLVLGLAKNSQVLEKLFEHLETDINERIKENEIIDWEGTSISFGSKIFEKQVFHDKIIRLMMNMPKIDKSFVKDYYGLLEKIRDELTRCLDLRKFKLLLNGNPEHSILYRNLSLLKLHEYKTNTRTYLCKVSDSLNNGSQKQVDDSLLTSYGLRNMNVKDLQEFE